MNGRAVGVLLVVAASVTAVVATFQPLSWVGTRLGAHPVGFTTTAWDTVSDPPDLAARIETAQLGVPIVIAAVLLAIAAALVFLPAHQRRVGRYLAVAASGLLGGAVWATSAVVRASLAEDERTRGTIEYESGPGLWLLLAAVAVAAVGTVLLHSDPVPAPVGVVVHRLDPEPDDDADTPPFGIPVAVLPEERPVPPEGEAR